MRSVGSLGGSTAASSRISYQFPTALSIGTPLRSESNASTPSRAVVGGGSRGGPLGAYAAVTHPPVASWHRTAGAHATGGGGLGGGGLGGAGQSSSSSLVSLHGVRLSSWGSLPSRSSSSPAHPPNDTAVAAAATDAEASAVAHSAANAAVEGAQAAVVPA